MSQQPQQQHSNPTPDVLSPTALSRGSSFALRSPRVPPSPKTRPLGSHVVLQSTSSGCLSPAPVREDSSSTPPTADGAALHAQDSSESYAGNNSTNNNVVSPNTRPTPVRRVPSSRPLPRWVDKACETTVATTVDTAVGRDDDGGLHRLEASTQATPPSGDAHFAATAGATDSEWLELHRDIVAFLPRIFPDAALRHRALRALDALQDDDAATAGFFVALHLAEQQRRTALLLKQDNATQATAAYADSTTQCGGDVPCYSSTQIAASPSRCRSATTTKAPQRSEQSAMLRRRRRETPPRHRPLHRSVVPGVHSVSLTTGPISPAASETDAPASDALSPALKSPGPAPQPTPPPRSSFYFEIRSLSRSVQPASPVQRQPSQQRFYDPPLLEPDDEASPPTKSVTIAAVGRPYAAASSTARDARTSSVEPKGDAISWTSRKVLQAIRRHRSTTPPRAFAAASPPKTNGAPYTNTSLARQQSAGPTPSRAAQGRFVVGRGV